MAESFEDLPKLRNAIYKAAKERDAAGLLRLLRSADAASLLILMEHAEVKGIYSTGQNAGFIAGKHGDVDCLRVLDMCGVKFPQFTLSMAAWHGHVDCLAFAVSCGCKPWDYLVQLAVMNGHLACVDFLIEQGLPVKPYVYYGRDDGRVGPDQIECFQLMADRGVRIDPFSMHAAVEWADVDFVRWLHQHGVPLWKHAIQEKRNFNMYKGADTDLAYGPETLMIPGQPERVEGMWKSLRYGAVHGAPITPTVKGFFNRMRQRSRAVLMSFKVVERQCTAPLPSALVEEILILADLEIRETMLGPRPAEVPLGLKREEVT